MTMQPVRKLAPMTGGAMSYLEWEHKGAPALHFAHATGFNAQTYQSLLGPLAGRFHIYASDARGHGLTALGAARGLASNWTVFRDDLLAFLDDVGGKPMILAGHSMGAVVSVLTAIARPHLVRGLVLIEPVLMPQMAWPSAMLRRMMAGREAPNLAERAARRRDTFPTIEAAFQAYKGRGAFGTWPDEMLRDYLDGGMALDTRTEQAHLTCAPWWEAETFRGTPQGTSRKARLLNCPVTILQGLAGSTASDGEVQTFVHGHPGTRVIRLPEASHFLPMEFPDLVREEIHRMADELRPHLHAHGIIAA
ncbi:MAG TPA: alpha/beta hydrolase [Rhizomicrobium sp.]|nr:alpha/beta hydrolase [Rhizomicrobium sp.]